MIEWFDDLALGMRFKSGSVQITEGDIKRFAAEYDPQPMHMDEAAAAKTAFKGLAASGWHTAAIAMNLAVQIRPFAGSVMRGYSLRSSQPLHPRVPSAHETGTRPSKVCVRAGSKTSSTLPAHRSARPRPGHRETTWSPNTSV